MTFKWTPGVKRLTFTRSMHSTLTYHTHHVYLKYVKTIVFLKIGRTIKKEFVEKNFPPIRMSLLKNLITTLTRVIACLKNVQFVSYLKLLMI